MLPEELVYRPIGKIISPYEDPAHGPIQPCYCGGTRGKVEVFQEYAEGLKDLEGYSHIYLIYHCHKAVRAPMLAKPFISDEAHGLFSTRLPGRPNPIGMSIVRMLAREGNILHIEDIDALNGSPLLDIKPYSRRFDCISPTRDGWQGKIEDAEAARKARQGRQ